MHHTRLGADCATSAWLCHPLQRRGDGWQPPECACRLCILAFYGECLRVKLLVWGVAGTFRFLIGACHSV